MSIFRQKSFDSGKLLYISVSLFWVADHRGMIWKWRVSSECILSLSWWKSRAEEAFKSAKSAEIFSPEHWNLCLRDVTHAPAPNCLPRTFCYIFLLKPIPFRRDFQWHMWRLPKRTFTNRRWLAKRFRRWGSHDSLLVCTQRVNKPYNLCCTAQRSLSSLSSGELSRSPKFCRQLTAHFRWLYRRRLFPVRRFLFRYENKHKTLCGSSATRQKLPRPCVYFESSKVPVDSGWNFREFRHCSLYFPRNQTSLHEVAFFQSNFVINFYTTFLLSLLLLGSESNCKQWSCTEYWKTGLKWTKTRSPKDWIDWVECAKFYSFSIDVVWRRCWLELETVWECRTRAESEAHVTDKKLRCKAGISLLQNVFPRFFGLLKGFSRDWSWWIALSSVGRMANFFPMRINE